MGWSCGAQRVRSPGNIRAGVKRLDPGIDRGVLRRLAVREERDQAPAHLGELRLTALHPENRHLLSRCHVLGLKERRRAVFFPLPDRLRLLANDVSATHKGVRSGRRLFELGIQLDSLDRHVAFIRQSVIDRHADFRDIVAHGFGGFVKHVPVENRAGSRKQCQQVLVRHDFFQQSMLPDP
jgi:hypothetical protein